MSDELNYDVVIIGAGIQGAGVAQAAAACKYKTLVLEKHPDAGMGTSGKSSKLIHGGLRYLETAQFSLVIESLLERKRLLKNAPHLVKLIPFFIPIYRNSSRPAWFIWLGLCIYSIFSLKKFSIVKKTEWKDLDGLNLKNLKAVFKYYDAQTNDTQLTRAVINSAIELGADVRYNANFLKSQANTSCHQLVFTQNEKKYNVMCKCIINCSGPWAESTQSHISPALKLPNIDLVSGTHIVIKHMLTQGAYYIQAEDKRAIFVLPWNSQEWSNQKWNDQKRDKQVENKKNTSNQTLIGTTETAYFEDPDNVSPSQKEISYLLKNYNTYFNTPMTNDDILQSFSGLRVLPANPLKHNDIAFKKSRDSLLCHNATATPLIALIGGKLTTYRASAEKTVNLLKKLLPLNNISPSRTRNIKLK